MSSAAAAALHLHTFYLTKFSLELKIKVCHVYKCSCFSVFSDIAAGGHCVYSYLLILNAFVTILQPGWVTDISKTPMSTAKS